MEPLRIAICDDQTEEREKLLLLVEQAPIQTKSILFASSEDLVEAFEPGIFDLLLMDIYMDGMTGVEAVQKIRKIDAEIPVAFTTTSTEHALESYRLSVLKYIEKPVKSKDIHDLLQLVKLKKENTPSLSIKQNGIEEKIPVSDILYLETASTPCSHCTERRQGITTLRETVHHLIASVRGTALFLPT